jgi:uncharacterized protein (DUF342 family)
MNKNSTSQTPLTSHPLRDYKPATETGGEHPMIFVEIPPDEMSARVTILPPASADDKFVTVDDLHIALAKYNVVYGINNNALTEVAVKISQHAAAKNLTDIIEADLAAGTPAVKSQDARIEYFYKNGDEPAPSRDLPEDEDGRVDYKAGRKLDNVVRGSLLIRKTPLVPGKPGKTVTGMEITPAPPKDIILIVGKGVIANPENPDEFYADADGQVVFKGGRISIQPIYEVRGDVNLSVGNIAFYGTVIVHGDVKEGFKVHAGVDLIVRGVVEGADLKVDGDLTVSGGVIGNDKARIICKGDALIQYIQNATVEVAGDLSVRQSIMHSKIACDRTVTVAGQKGMIVGGQVIARREITAAIIGANFGTSTEIIVGEQVDLRDQILSVDAQLTEFSRKMEKTKKALAYLKQMHAQRGGNLPPDKKELYTWLSRALVKLTSETKIFLEKKQDLEAKQRVYLEEKPVPRINCIYIIYPGVKVTINRAFRAFSDEQKYCSLIEADGEVRISPLKITAKTKIETDEPPSPAK